MWRTSADREGAQALLRQAVATDDGIAAISHRLPITPPDGGVPTTYTVHLAPDNKGTFLVTCRELPEVTTFGEDEEEALSMAEEAIREALEARRKTRPNSPDLSSG